MTFIADAESAEDIGDAFSKFKAPVPDHGPEITASIAELYAIGSSLRDIVQANSSAEYGRNYYLIEEDMELACSSLQETVADIFKTLGEIGNGAKYLSDGMYRQTWKDITFSFAQYGRMPLRKRLETFRKFFVELNHIVRKQGSKSFIVSDLRIDIQSLDPIQDRGSDSFPIGGGRGTLSKPRSYEKKRPSISPPPLRTGGFPDFASLSMSDGPASPPSTVTQNSDSSSDDFENDHWAMRVFSELSTTKLSRSGSISKCYGESSQGVRRSLQDDEFVDIFEIAFASGPDELIVRLYHRARDDRARIMCKWPRSSGNSYHYACLPLNVLEFYRFECSLQICRKRKESSKLDIWANLAFSSIERLVIFHSMLVSLRGQDAARPVTRVIDNELEGEAEFFGGLIVDDGYLHALRVYRDRDSKAIRLHASVHQGEMKKTPVWTAFVTHYVTSRSWIRTSSSNSCVLYLTELKRHVFTSTYQPPKKETGEHIIKFASKEDAEAFKRSIQDLAEYQGKRPKLQSRRSDRPADFGQQPFDGFFAPEPPIPPAAPWPIPQQFMPHGP